MNKKQAMIMLFLIILIFSCVRLFLLSGADYCFGWDCPFYLRHISEGNYLTEYTDPFYFMIANPLNSIIGNEVMTVKFLMILMPIVLSIGVFILSRKALDEKYSLLTVALVNILIGMSRMWNDLYRNYMMIAIMPFFFYFFLEDDNKSTLIATILLIVMSMTHMTFIAIIPFMFLYALYMRNKKIWKKVILISIITLLLYSFLTIVVFQNEFGLYKFVDYVFNEAIDKSTGETITYKVNENMLGALHRRVYWFNFFSSGLIMMALFSVIFINREDKYLSAFSLFILTIFLFSLITQLGVATDRMILYSMLPTAIVSMILLTKYMKRIILPKYLKCFVPIVILIVMITGIIYITELRESISDGEKLIIERLTYKPDALVISTSRMEYWFEYFWDERYNYRIMGWDKLKGKAPPDNLTKIITGTPQESLDELNRLSIRNKEIYIFFDYELDQMNKSIISEKDFLQEIYSNKNTTLLYFGDEKAENFIGEENYI